MTRQFYAITLKLKRIMDCVTKQTRITHKEYFAYKYGAMISSVSDYACAAIPNDKILNLKQVKDEPPRNPSTIFRVRVRTVFE